jgi:hypothetical protein
MQRSKTALYDEVAGYVVLAIGVLLAVLNALNGWHRLNNCSGILEFESS